MNIEHYKKRILLAVTGMSPQIVTETLYALAVNPVEGERFVPTEIHLLTTSRGADNARLELLSGTPGWFNRLRADYQLPPIAFDETHIHVLTNSHGEVLDDIRTVEDNERAADFFTEKMRAFTQEEDSALHVSIAGGRKTMGFYLGYALSLFGRPQDRLSHVLVSSPFENNRDFFYPTPYERIIHTYGQQPIDAQDAEVMLANIPFVRLRTGIDKRLLQGGTTFSGAVAAAQRAFGDTTLKIDLPNRMVEFDGKRFNLPNVQIALLAVLARHSLNSTEPLMAPCKDVPDEEWKERLVIELLRIEGPATQFDDLKSSTRHSLNKGLDQAYFSSSLSKLQKLMREVVGPNLVGTLFDIRGNNTNRLYRLNTVSCAICFETVGSVEESN